jgi:prevent-host-death family protein
MSLTAPRPISALPDWAFRSLATHAIETLIDRTEHETVMVTRRGRPDVVLVGHDEWARITAMAKRAGDDTADTPPGGDA